MVWFNNTFSIAAYEQKVLQPFKNMGVNVCNPACWRSKAAR